MQEPVDCQGCGDIVELQQTRTCKRCRQLFCPDCLNKDRHCEDCADLIEDEL